ncbi:MAG: hypothetical protein AB1782_17810 [Cyanobacteriota bacterium]
MINYLIAFALTQIIEIPVAYLFGYRKALEIFAIFLINLITHPTLNIFIHFCITYNLLPLNILTITLLEIAVALIEWGLLVYVFGLKSIKKLFLLSFTMNTASYLSGLFIFPL